MDTHTLQTGMKVTLGFDVTPCVKKPGGHLYSSSLRLPEGTPGAIVCFWEGAKAPLCPGQYVLVGFGGEPQPLYIQACSLLPA